MHSSVFSSSSSFLYLSLFSFIFSLLSIYFYFAPFPYFLWNGTLLRARRYPTTPFFLPRSLHLRDPHWRVQAFASTAGLWSEVLGGPAPGHDLGATCPTITARGSPMSVSPSENTPRSGCGPSRATPRERGGLRAGGPASGLRVDSWILPALLSVNCNIDYIYSAVNILSI